MQTRLGEPSGFARRFNPAHEAREPISTTERAADRLRTAPGRFPRYKPTNSVAKISKYLKELEQSSEDSTKKFDLASICTSAEQRKKTAAKLMKPKRKVLFDAIASKHDLDEAREAYSCMLGLSHALINDRLDVADLEATKDNVDFLVDYRAMSVEKDKAISERQAMSVEKDKAISERQAMSVEKDKAVSERQADADEFYMAMEEFRQTHEKTIQEKDHEIAVMRQCVVHAVGVTEEIFASFQDLYQERNDMEEVLNHLD
ncbi:hypothetical protein K504DRAFT_466746 [Pleomassaria siparia CBS 279.74]|uniref:Uncharacterized protein n=1 Tax=Pleomassaria siparia CBS 279.74 TaxID=1314801 RepID=A0A6G1KCH1_9PLEO|nr:hypothetical protein K504DRAFT_466746 [Pleomassaria siparia CBS 279.74]